MANMIARLGVLLGLDTAEFNKGLADSGKKLDSFVSGMNRAATVAAAAFTAMTAKAMVFADEIADVAQANDVAIDTVIKLQNALANSGGKADSAGKLFASFTNYVDKAAEGSFEAQKNFAKMGIGLTDLANLSTQDLFTKAVEGIAKIEDPLTRSAKAMEVFGKAAKGVDFVGIAQGMKDGADVTDRQANAIKLLAEFYDKLGQASRDATLNFANFLEPALRRINDILESISRLSQSGNFFGGLAEKFKAEFTQGRIQATLEEIERLNAKIADPNVGEFWKSGYRQELAEAKKLLDELRGPQKQSTQADVRRLDPVEYVPIPGKKGPVRDVKEGVNPEEEKRRREAEAAARRAADSIRRYQAEQEALDQAEVAYGKLVSSMVDYEKAQSRRIDLEEQLIELDLKKQGMADYEFEYRRKMIELNHQQIEALREINQMELMPDDRAKRIEKQNQLYERQVGLIKKVRDTEELRRTGDITKGFMEAAQDFFQKMPTEMETGAAMFGSLMGNMGQALDNFVRTGKMNFKDFAKSVILDLIAIQVKAQAMKLFANLFGFGPAPAGGTTVPVVDAIPRANGGPVSGNEAYLVGERGPELFVPRMSGSIIPNKAMSMGGTTQVTNNYINAIDVKSFEERIMGSSNAVWAANLYAQKRLPLGAGRM